MQKFVLLSLILSLSYAGTNFRVGGSEPNPPTWPDTVTVCDSSDSVTCQAAIDKVYAQNGGQTPDNNGQWSEGRYAIFFKPGLHNVNVNVGYYTSIYGLGATPYETMFSQFQCESGSSNPTTGSLDTFWRSAENFMVFSTKTWNSKVTTLWSVSQAAPLRRAVINGDLDLYEFTVPGQHAGYASGGFMADVTVTGTIDYGTQQQWANRNVDAKNYVTQGGFNFLFMGCENAPASRCGGGSGIFPANTFDGTPTIAEKPYITYDGEKYLLNRPRYEINKVGPTTDYDNAEQIDFSQVYVATEKDTAATINAKLDAGLHLVLSPGTYNLDDTIKVNNANTVVLGIGFANLVSTTGKPCMIVGNVDGVRIAGILFQAGPVQSDSLLQWGTGKYAGNAAAPGVMSDIFARVGGMNDSTKNEMTTKTMVTINSSHVVYDNTWLWRADHDVQGSVMDSHNPVDSGLVVNGDDVTAYGLASEHSLQNLVVWKGERGTTYWYQSELPYDVDVDYGTNGYSGYHVDDAVTTHTAYGIGVYSFFRDHPVQAPSGITTPSKPGISFTNSFTVWLWGPGSNILHIINEYGGNVPNDGRNVYYCTFPPTNSTDTESS